MGRKALPAVLSAWIACIIGGSVLPWSAKLRLHTFARSHSATELDFHRLLHIAMFATTAAIAFLATRKWWLSAVLAFGLGVSVEYLESAIYLNRLEWYDIRDDGLGTIIGLVCLAIFYRWRETSLAQEPH